MFKSLFLFTVCALSTEAQTAPSGLIEVNRLDPTIQVEMRYSTDWNFMGRPVKGYRSNKCYLTKEAAYALTEVQKDLKAKDLGILALDCYRPTQAVADFVAWTKSKNDQTMKPIFYPDETKSELISRGYIADKSGHSRGSTIDLTLISLGALSLEKPLGEKLRFKEDMRDCRWPINIQRTGQLDMGTSFDCFSILANTQNSQITAIAKKNRQLLLDAMKKHGFINYEKEWWHFTLKEEPFKDSYFDFPID